MNDKWFLVNEGLIFDSYTSLTKARSANRNMFWDTASVVDSETLSKDFGLDPKNDKNWVEYYA